jgi:transcriptional regulator with XRE-family HTH domain/DNA-directed RNA polymerase subunit RPC12/RpoP
MIEPKGGYPMDQVKIGRFIAAKRKEQNLTQAQLAEKLSITDRAISKWENGRSLPDSSVMLTLCEILQITVNDLLSGEVVTMENYTKELENKLMEMVKQKEQNDKMLLRMEILIGIICMVIFFALVIVASYVNLEEWLRVLLILIGFAPLLIATPFMLKIEQKAGYYECRECGHRYIPTFKAVNLAPHMGRTRYMRCPECGKKSWQKKRISKE